LTTSLETTTSWLFVPLTSFFIPPGLGRQFLKVSLLRERERERCCVCVCVFVCGVVRNISCELECKSVCVVRERKLEEKEV